MEITFLNWRHNFTGTIMESIPDSDKPGILVKADENSSLPYESVLFYLEPEYLDWEKRTGERVRITCSDMFLESLPPIGSLLSIGTADVNPAE